jgi:hypothetical protein
VEKMAETDVLEKWIDSTFHIIKIMTFTSHCISPMGTQWDLTMHQSNLNIALVGKRAESPLFKWNVIHLTRKVTNKQWERWARFPKDALILFQLRRITQHYRQPSQQKAMEFRKKFNIRDKPEVAIAILHDDTNDIHKPREVNKMIRSLEAHWRK